MGDSAYSFSLTTFSRTGKLLQIEYALNAVANGRTALGIAAVDGVVIATDKKFGSPLVEGSGVRKVEKITDGSGFVYAGVGPDYRVLGKLKVVVGFTFLPYVFSCWQRMMMMMMMMMVVVVETHIEVAVVIVNRLLVDRGRSASGFMSF